MRRNVTSRRRHVRISALCRNRHPANRSASGVLPALLALMSEPAIVIYPPMSQERPSHRHARPGSPGRNFSGAWRKTPGRLFGTGLVRAYQLSLSGFVGNSCRHLPTCSEYAYEAIARHGLWAGSWLGFFRVLRCGPGGTHGIDNVPEGLDPGLHWFTPWRYWRPGKRLSE